MFQFFSLLLAFYITAVLVPLTSRLARSLGAMDEPDGVRKVHQTPTPRTGAIALAGGILIPAWLWLPLDPQFKAFFTGAAVIFVFGLLDDLFDLDYKKKLLGQAIAATITMVMSKTVITSIGIWGGVEIDLPTWIGAPLTFFLLVGITNAINLADGLDGLAGGLCILVFGGIGILAYVQGVTAISTCCLIIVGAILGFLRYNTYPATVFMGDTGAQLLGFSAGVFCIYLTQAEMTPLSRLLPLLIVGFPIFDTVTVMLERISDGSSPFSADKRHFHHRLLNIGASPVGSVVFIYLIQGIMTFLSIYLRYYPEDWILFAYLLTILPPLMLLFLNKRFGFRLASAQGWTEKRRETGNVYKFRESVQKWSLHVLNVLLSVGLIWLALSCPKHTTSVWELTLFLLVGLVVVTSYWVRISSFPYCVRFCIYMLGLYVLITTRDANMAFTQAPVALFNYFFWGTLVGLVVIYLVSTRFKNIEITTLDYLLLLLVSLLPFLPVEQIREYHIGSIAGGMIALLWATEILMRNTGRHWNMLTLSSLTSVFIVGGRGFIH